MIPPRNAPTIPISIVTMMPPGSFPGMIALAIAPAIKPRTIHATIPIKLPPQRGSTWARPKATSIPAPTKRLAFRMHDEDVIGKAYDARLMRRLSVYVRPYGWLVVSALCCLMLDGLMQLVGPLMTQRVIDIALPSHDVALVWRSATIFALSLAVAFAC